MRALAIYRVWRVRNPDFLAKWGTFLAFQALFALIFTGVFWAIKGHEGARQVLLLAGSLTTLPLLLGFFMWPQVWREHQALAAHRQTKAQFVAAQQAKRESELDRAQVALQAAAEQFFEAQGMGPLRATVRASELVDSLGKDSRPS